MRQPRLPQNIAQLTRGTRNPGYPEPGWFKLRLVRRGQAVPALIWLCHHEPGDPDNHLDTGPILVAKIGDNLADPLDVWQWATKITEAEYNFLMADRAWAVSYSPSDPAALPYQSVDLSKRPSLY